MDIFNGTEQVVPTYFAKMTKLCEDILLRDQ